MSISLETYLSSDSQDAGAQVRAWLEGTKRTAHEKGEVHVVSGRRRPLPNINSADSRSPPPPRHFPPDATHAARV